MAAFLPPIVGFTGRAGAGKDTCAAWLVERYGYVRYSCADPIKDLLNRKFGWEGADWADRSWKEAPILRDSCTDMCFSPRELAQWLGTEVGRALAGDDVWIEALLVKAASEGNHARTVIADIRFNNEAEKIQRRGGIVINVYRKDLPPVTDHVSERGVDDLYIDYEVNNSGSILDIQPQLDRILFGWERDFGRARA